MLSWVRPRANSRVVAVVVGIAALAACNALLVPLRLEHQVRCASGNCVWFVETRKNTQGIALHGHNNC